MKAKTWLMCLSIMGLVTVIYGQNTQPMNSDFTACYGVAPDFFCGYVTSGSSKTFEIDGTTSGYSVRWYVNGNYYSCDNSNALSDPKLTFTINSNTTITGYAYNNSCSNGGTQVPNKSWTWYIRTSNPTCTNASNIGLTTATLNWTSATPNSSGVVRYIARYKQTTSPTWITACTTSASSCNISGLNCNSNYEYQVRYDCNECVNNNYSIVNSSNWSSSCQFSTVGPSISVPSGTTVGSVAGSLNIPVTSNGCLPWSVSSNCGWVSLSPSSSTGNGSVYVSYQNNPTCTTRTCIITFISGTAASSYVLTQEGIAPSISLPVGTTVGSGSGSINITVTANSCCSWHASANNTWVSLSPSNSTGSGTVTVTYQQNTSCNQRYCTITLSCGSASASYEIIQNGAAPTIFVPTGGSVPSNAGNISIPITSNGCATWSTSTNCSWISLNPSTGNGNSSTSASYQQNTNCTQRTCIITFSSGSAVSTYTLTQSGAACTITVPSSSTVSANQGSINIPVASNGCAPWQANHGCSWVYVTPGSGTGSQNVNATYQQNTSTIQRTCVITFSCASASDTYTLIQQPPISNIDDIEYLRSFSIHPNPTSREFTLEMELICNKNLEVRINNIMGQVIYHEKLGEVTGKFQKKFDLGEYSKGIYTIELISEEGVVNKKIVVQ